MRSSSRRTRIFCISAIVSLTAAHASDSTALVLPKKKQRELRIERSTTRGTGGVLEKEGKQGKLKNGEGGKGKEYKHAAWEQAGLGAVEIHDGGIELQGNLATSLVSSRNGPKGG